MQERIYVCHTFYHVYVTCLKELAIRRAFAYAEGKADRVRLKARAAAVSGSGAQTVEQASATQADSAQADDPLPHPRAATLVLSKMSTDFGSLVARAKASGLFADVIEFDEKGEDFFPELAPLREDTGSRFRNMKNRIAFCKRFPELEAPFVQVDFRQYKDIYVFCDSDPIGYYLNANGICYHAVEDGLNCLKRFDAARFDNRGAFALKKWMAEKGHIFIQNGYAKYCLDMEVNDISVIGTESAFTTHAENARSGGKASGDARDGDAALPAKPAAHSGSGKPHYVECPRKALTDALTKTDRMVLTQLFIENLPALKAKLAQGADAFTVADDNRQEHTGPETVRTARPRILILTERILDEPKRESLFREIVSRYATWNGLPALVMIKPHPRDTLDYERIFRNESGYGNPAPGTDAVQVTAQGGVQESSPDVARNRPSPDVVVLSGSFPMEMLNFIDGLRFDAVVSIFTQTDAITFADAHISLAEEFAYAAPEVRQAQEAKE